MANPIWKGAAVPLTEAADSDTASEPPETKSLNLPENSDSAQQQEVLDALPVLVFLERAGKVVFANVEARQTLGLADGDWVPRPVEDVLWGLFPGTAEPQTQLLGTRAGSPFHATMPARNGRLLAVEGTYSLLNPELREAISMKPMTIEEAVKDAEFRDRDLLIFRNPGGEMFVLHRRRDGQMELVEIS